MEGSIKKLEELYAATSVFFLINTKKSFIIIKVHR